MAYSLENAVANLRNDNPWLLNRVDFEPLEGLTDGTNRVFRTAHRPLDQASGLTLYNQAGDVFSTGSYAVISWDSGAIRFTTAPSAQYYADYCVADEFYGAAKLKELCREGFRGLMARWSQPWYLVDSGGSTYVSSTAGAVTDPPIGGVTFSTCHEALHVYHLCCEYELIASRLRAAASLDVDYREGMSGGVAVTTSHRAKALDALLDKINEELAAALAVLEEALTGEGFGGFVSGAKSGPYESTYEWWDSTDQAGET